MRKSLYKKLLAIVTILPALTGGVGGGALLCSCYDDQGNYDYHELDAVAIDTTDAGIQQEYALMRFDTLVLEPKVRFRGEEVKADEAPLDYTWTIFSATSGSGANATIDTIGTERRLNAVINRTGGNYYVSVVGEGSGTLAADASAASTVTASMTAVVTTVNTIVLKK